MMKPKIKQAPLKESAMLLAAEQEEKSTERANFSDATKAKIYARDRAICGLSGLSLWLLEEGACGFYAWTHIDHIHPASKGGSASEDNGTATHWLYNKNKRDNVQALYLFDSGAPTMSFFMVHRQLSPEMAQRLAIYAEIHHSDWYLNSALSNLLEGVCWLHEWKDWGYTRDDEYYAKTALKRIEQWRSTVKAENVDSIEDRGLVLDPPLPDQQLLLSLREKSSVKQIQELMKEILPYHAANTALVAAFQTEYEKYLEGETVDFGSVWDFQDNPYVSDDTFGRMIINMRLIADPHDTLQMDEQTESGEVN